MSETIKQKSRIILKHDIAENWGKAVNFIPLAGEIIIYDDLGRFKIGNGITLVNLLPFADDQKTQVQIVTWEDDD